VAHRCGQSTRVTEIPARYPERVSESVATAGSASARRRWAFPGGLLSAALGSVPPPALLLVGILSVQVGAGLAKHLFADASPAGITLIRLWSAAIILVGLGARGARTALVTAVRRRAWRDLAVAVSFGVALGVMNFSIYQAFARLPLGVAVTIEFLGPLGVAVAASRRARDLVWVLLAGGGVLLLTHGGGQITVAGVGFALVAAAAWAAYILLSAATGKRFPGSSGLAIAMVAGAVLVTPAGVASGGPGLLRPGVLAVGAGVGMLSSVIPYRIELEALRRLPPRVFGVLMSLEPAVAALVGLAVLGERLGVRDWAAIVLVMAACAGALSGRRAVQSE
jgi:threonine/homoserine efflux transporter RhtA